MKRYTYFSKKQRKASRKTMAQRNQGFYLTGESWFESFMRTESNSKALASMFLSKLFKGAGI